jgi:hypothetical protein
MKTTKIKSRDWKKYFASVNAELKKKQVFIEVASLTFGDQIQSDWTRLNGVTYDSMRDVFEIYVPGIDHRIRRLQEINVASGYAGIEAIEIKDTDGVQHILRLREPLALPEPAGVPG